MSPRRFAALVGRRSAAVCVGLVAFLLPAGGIEWPPTRGGLALLAAFDVGFGLLLAAAEVASGHHREFPAPARDELDREWAAVGVDRRNGHRSSALRLEEPER